MQAAQSTNPARCFRLSAALTRSQPRSWCGFLLPHAALRRDPRSGARAIAFPFGLSPLSRNVRAVRIHDHFISRGRLLSRCRRRPMTPSPPGRRRRRRRRLQRAPHGPRHRPRARLAEARHRRRRRPAVRNELAAPRGGHGTDFRSGRFDCTVSASRAPRARCASRRESCPRSGLKVGR